MKQTINLFLVIASFIDKPLIPLLPMHPHYPCDSLSKNNQGNKNKISTKCSFDDKRKEKNFQLWAPLWTCWKRKKHRGIEELQCFSNNLKRRHRCRIQLSIWWRGLISGEKRQEEECSYRNMWCMVVELMIYSLCWISFKEGMMELRNNPIVICYVIVRRMERGWQRSLWHECVYIYKVY